MEIEKRRVYAIVDFDALDQNVQAMEEKLPQDVGMMAVIKTNAYGHGAKAIAKHLEDNDRISGYAVATAEEALELRKAGIGKMILILGYVFEKDYEDLILQDIRFGIYRKDVAQALDAAAEKCHKKALIHIKIDTGMHRIGYPVCQESVEEIKEIAGLKHLCLEGIFTHFARADEADKSGVRKQMARFDVFLELLRQRGATLPTVHVAASPTICDLPEYDRDMVRPGLLLTGYYTSEEVSRERIHLVPCIKLKARLGNIMPVAAGEGIGYGFTYHTSRDSIIGLLPLGFSDGFTRAFSNRFFVTIRGYRCPVVGNICMDHCMIDLTDLPNPQIGEEIVVYGDGLNGPDGAMNIQEVADLRGTIVDEVMTNLAARLPRRYV